MRNNYSATNFKKQQYLLLQSHQKPQHYHLLHIVRKRLWRTEFLLLEKEKKGSGGRQLNVLTGIHFSAPSSSCQESWRQERGETEKGGKEGIRDGFRFLFVCFFRGEEGKGSLSLFYRKRSSFYSTGAAPYVPAPLRDLHKPSLQALSGHCPANHMAYCYIKQKKQGDAYFYPWCLAGAEEGGEKPVVAGL